MAGLASQKTRYDDEELEILKALESGSLRVVKDSARQLEAHRAAASATFKKDERLNIRISSRDLKQSTSSLLKKSSS